MAVEKKALYHALCVMAGNFPQILWHSLSGRFSDRLGIPPDILEPYLRQSLDNFLADPGRALTGPLARGDRNTVRRNLSALSGDALQDLYRAFVELHSREAQAPGLREEVL